MQLGLITPLIILPLWSNWYVIADWTGWLRRQLYTKLFVPLTDYIPKTIIWQGNWVWHCLAPCLRTNVLCWQTCKKRPQWPHSVAKCASNQLAGEERDRECDSCEGILTMPFGEDGPYTSLKRKLALGSLLNIKYEPTTLMSLRQWWLKVLL